MESYLKANIRQFLEEGTEITITISFFGNMLKLLPMKLTLTTRLADKDLEIVLFDQSCSSYFALFISNIKKKGPPRKQFGIV